MVLVNKFMGLEKDVLVVDKVYKRNSVGVTTFISKVAMVARQSPVVQTSLIVAYTQPGGKSCFTPAVWNP